ncbi:MAG: hypothetical protein ABUS49_02295 [Acidobacteriota bacterium]
MILLGLGFTTRRLARRLLLRRVPVQAVARDPSRFCDLASIGLRITELSLASAAPLSPNSVIVHTIPPLLLEENNHIRRLISGLNPRRVIYISSTSIYGKLILVDENSTVEPAEEKGRQRLEEEMWLVSQPWSSLIIRPAAIYGPGRGIHVRLRDGRAPRSAPAGVVSRIHVDDLAAILEAGVFSDLEGAWPAADHQPCSTAAISDWCTELLRLGSSDRREEPIRMAGRSVDGSAIRERLAIMSAYPGYTAGILASLAEA